MKALKVLKNIGLWVAVSVLLIISLASINTFACIFGFIAIAIILPIQKWQSLLKKFLKTPIRIIALVVSIITMLAIIGISNGNSDTDTYIDTVAPIQTESDTSAFTETVNATSAGSTPTQTTETEPNTTSPPTTTSEPATEPVLSTTSEPITEHTHSFSKATCTQPKTCSCGATTGSANGHTWKAATCTTAKTCSVCYATSGSPTGHSYSNGKCSSCGIKDPDYVSETMVWIPTNGGTKYHTHSGCSNMKGPRQVTKSEAISLGFDPCKKCYR